MKLKFSLAVFLFLYLPISAQSDLKILSSSGTSLTIEYTPICIDTTYFEIGSQKFYKFDLQNSLSDNLYPEDDFTPYREINVGVPGEFGNTIQILSADFTEIDGRLTNARSPKEFEVTKQRISSSSLNKELVSFGEYGLARDLLVQTIKVYPIVDKADIGKIRLYKKILFRINFAQSTGAKEKLENPLLKEIVVNPTVAENWGTGGKSRTTKAVFNSVLSTGTWYKFVAPEEGIYKIDRNSLQSYGIDPNNVDPRTIKIYNNGGYVLPENMNTARPVDLEEVAIMVVGEDDGSFDANDYILFYGRSNDFWEYNVAENKITRNKNWYSADNYFWITSGGDFGKRITARVSTNQSGGISQTTSISYKFLDEDIINLGLTGRDFWGDELNSTNTSNTYITTLNERVPGTNVNYKFRVVNASSPSFSFQVEETSNTIYTTTLGGFGSYKYSFGYDRIATVSSNMDLPENRSTLRFSIITGALNAKAYLDYYEIEYTQYLRATENEIIFYSPGQDATVDYTVSNFSNSDIFVFDVTDYANVKIVQNGNVSGGQLSFQAIETANNISKYFGVNGNNYLSPESPVAVANQNLHSYQTGAEYVIISNRNFSEQAERLRNFRNGQSPYPLSSHLVYIEDIINEFGGGFNDPTSMRDYLKYCYENWDTRPFYVLFFGDGDYDYQNILGLGVNYVLTYQTKESLQDLSSYPMDDYFGRIAGADEKADLALGRLPVQTKEDARIIVDKIINYETESNLGLWRNNITLVADDGLTSEGDDGARHTSQSERLAESIIPSYLDKNKIYLAAYPEVITGLGRKKPEVNEAIINAVNNGTLILNYIGHGNPQLWAHEDVFEKEITIPQFVNEDYFFLTAATCDFGKYDDPANQSATEEMIFLEDAGAIGAFTASRPVYSNQNAAMNDTFYTKLFSGSIADHLPVRIGEAYYLTKQSRTSTNDEKFHLFLDPAIRLNEPKLPVSIDSVNHSDLSLNVQIKALGNVNLKGTVRNENGIPQNFNGEAIITVYDSERSVELSEINYEMMIQGGVIFRGRTSVNSGEFNTGFTVPKDISYENKNGKIVAYIFNDDQDGVGYTTNVIVGGTDSTAVNDNTGPEIEIHFDDLSYESSYLVNPDFNLLVKLNDETGLNTTGTGVGHKLEGILDDDEDNPIDFSNYFLGDLDAGGKSGVIDYSFINIEPGEHKIRVKAWDVFNNPSFAEVYFSVVEDDGLVIRDVVNYPNPFSGQTTFTFQHNLTSTLNVKIKIYTIAGRLIKEIESNDILDKFVRIPWDGRDEDGNRLANGTYLYKLIVNTFDGSYSENILGKLAIIR